MKDRTWRTAGIQIENERIRKLEHELYLARQAIVRLAPESLSRSLQSFYGCASRDETYRWEEDVLTAVIEAAEPLNRSEGAYLGQRAYCPLCRDGSSGPYDVGFALPEGLRRHLIGWGNTRQCDVTAAAFALARDCWNDQFAAAEEAERQRQEEEKIARQSTETLFRVSPIDEPRLIDEDAWTGKSPRNAEQLEWAEARLTALGFTIVVEGRVRSYVREQEDHVVYADPRLNGRVAFVVWKKPLPKKSRKPWRRNTRSFELQDAWKKSLDEKFQAMLQSALSSIGSK